MQTKVYLENPQIRYYIQMLNEHWRNKFYYDALNKHASGKVVLDMGSGTGILSFYALAAGAKFVYAVEQNEQSAELTHKVLSSKFDSSRFTVINCNFWTDDSNLSRIKHPIDLLVTETVGPGLFDQGMFHTWHCVKPYLAPNAISIPDTLSCDLWVWEKQLDLDYIAKLERPDQWLSPEACINQDFVQALYSQEHGNRRAMQWTKVKSILTSPKYVYTNKVAYTMDNLPDLEFSSDDFPRHIKPNIAFDFEIDAPASVAIIGKISFETETLYLKDALYVPWEFCPFFNLDSAGRYNMVYNNLDLEYLSEEEWKVSF